MLKKCRMRLENMKNFFLTRPVLAPKLPSVFTSPSRESLADCFLTKNQL
jgi:hypothetical protein